MSDNLNFYILLDGPYPLFSRMIGVFFILNFIK